MSIEIIGVITIFAGLVCLFLGLNATLMVFIPFCTLGSAAALLIGGASIPPAHLFLLFAVFSTFTWGHALTVALRTLRLSEPGFWLMAMVLYGVLSSYVMPRFFENETYIVPLGTTEKLFTSDGFVPLGRVSSNLTQSIYLIGNLICFTMIVAAGSKSGGFRALITGLILYGSVNIAFGCLDLFTSATGTKEALQFIRNAQYTFHDEENIGSLRRIIGSWPEASGFAGVTLGVLGFTGCLWLFGKKPFVTGSIAVLSLLFLIISTSSTGLVGSIFVIMLLYIIALGRCSTAFSDRYSAITVTVGPPLVLFFLIIILSNQYLYQNIYEYVDTLIISKSSTSSGLQRSSWNTLAWQNFLDTWGLGVGLGTNRTSSFPLALLSNLGIPGCVFYTLFLIFVFLKCLKNNGDYYADVRSASCTGLISLLIGSIIAGGTVDQGLLFYVFAGLACANPSE